MSRPGPSVTSEADDQPGANPSVPTGFGTAVVAGITTSTGDARYGRLAGSNTWTGTQDFTGATVTGVTGGGTADKLGLTPAAVKTANYTAAAGDLVPVDTTSGNVTITFPTAPADGAVVAVKHVIQGGSNTVSLALGGSDKFNKTGGPTTGTLTLVNQGLIAQYKATGAIWYVVADDLPLSGLDTRYDAAGAATTAQAASLQKTSNLSDVASASAARTSLGLGAAATMTTAQVAADSALTGTFATLTQVRDVDPTTQTALKTFKAALANRFYAPCDILFVGDSITEGQGATVYGRRWIDILRQRLQGYYSVPSVTGGAGFISSTLTSGVTMTRTGVVTLQGTTAPDQFGPAAGAQRAIQISTSTANGVDFTVTGTAVDILWAGGSSSGHFTYAVDGGSTTDVNTVKGTTTASNMTRVSLGSAGAHTIAIRWASGGTVFIEGVMVYNGDETKGVRCWDGGRYAADTVAYAGSATGFWPKSVLAIQPSLVVIELMANDFTFNVNPATSQTNLQTIISTVKANTTIPPSFLLVPPYKRTGSQTYTWQQYLDTAAAVAAADATVTVCDMGKRMPNVTGDTLSLYDGSVHPLDKGHAMWADSLFAWIAKNV